MGPHILLGEFDAPHGYSGRSSTHICPVGTSPHAHTGLDWHHTHITFPHYLPTRTDCRWRCWCRDTIMLNVRGTWGWSVVVLNVQGTGECSVAVLNVRGTWECSVAVLNVRGTGEWSIFPIVHGHKKILIFFFFLCILNDMKLKHIKL